MYATQPAMLGSFGPEELRKITDRETPRTGAIVVAVLDKAIGDANARVDSYLRGRYTLPFAVVPPELPRLACDIARYFLYDKQAPEEVRRAFEDAIRFLEKVAAGVVKLIQDTPASPVAAGAVLVSSPARVFSRDSLRDF